MTQFDKGFVSQSISETDEIGRIIAATLTAPACVYLEAEMGVGKTTLCKSIIHGLGYSGTVTSPTYNLIQEYPLAQCTVYHMDLYRLEDPSELEFLALPDLWQDSSLFLIEWPERGEGFLPMATHRIELKKQSEERRSVSFKAL